MGGRRTTGRTGPATRGQLRPLALDRLGILAFAGVPGVVLSDATAAAVSDSQAQEWEAFLAAIHEHFGAARWHVADLLRPMSVVGLGTPSPVLDAIASDVARDRFGMVSALSLGRYLLNRKKTYGGALRAIPGQNGQARQGLVDPGREAVMGADCQSLPDLPDNKVVMVVTGGFLHNLRQKVQDQKLHIDKK